MRGSRATKIPAGWGHGIERTVGPTGAASCDEAEVQGLVYLQQLEELLERSRGRRGGATLRAVLDEHAVGTTLTRSELEERTLALCRRARLPAPTVNADVAGASGRT